MRVCDAEVEVWVLGCEVEREGNPRMEILSKEKVENVIDIVATSIWEKSCYGCEGGFWRPDRTHGDRSNRSWRLWRRLVSSMCLHPSLERAFLSFHLTGHTINRNRGQMVGKDQIATN